MSTAVVHVCPAGGRGVSAIITAKAEPWRSWGAHLASFGAQAALVAESPYYKLLIGRVLGYKEDNVLHHIKVRGGGQAGRQIIGTAYKILHINKVCGGRWVALQH
jgi:hypothetical protein